jgi:hypothetical protein
MSYYSFQSVAKLLGVRVSDGTIHYQMKQQENNCYKKTTRNLLLHTHKENRRKCCMRIRTTFLKDVIPNINVEKYSYHQNERCCGFLLDFFPDETRLKQF